MGGDDNDDDGITYYDSVEPPLKRGPFQVSGPFRASSQEMAFTPARNGPFRARNDDDLTNHFEPAASSPLGSFEDKKAHVLRAAQAGRLRLNGKKVLPQHIRNIKKEETLQKYWNVLAADPTSDDDDEEESGRGRGLMRGYGLIGTVVAKQPKKKNRNILPSNIDATSGFKANANYVPFGKYLIHRHRLINDNVLMLRHKKGAVIAHLPSQRLSAPLGYVFQCLVGGGSSQLRQHRLSLSRRQIPTSFGSQIGQLDGPLLRSYTEQRCRASRE